MTQRFTLASSNTPTLFLIVSLVLAGAMSAAATAEELLSRSPERGGIGLDLQRDEDFIKSVQRDRQAYEEDFSTSLTRGCPSLSQIKPPRRPSPSRKSWVSWLKTWVSARLTLFQRWWDTANKFPDGISDCATNVFCNCKTDIVAGLSKMNGFPYQCPRAEGNQSTLDPFENEANGYTAIAFVNRFDLADQHSGKHCGEFRIVFARNSGFSA